jgi:hypothetical protein
MVTAAAAANVVFTKLRRLEGLLITLPSFFILFLSSMKLLVADSVIFVGLSRTLCNRFRFPTNLDRGFGFTRLEGTFVILLGELALVMSSVDLDALPAKKASV